MHVEKSYVIWWSFIPSILHGLFTEEQVTVHKSIGNKKVLNWKIFETNRF